MSLLLLLLVLGARNPNSGWNVTMTKRVFFQKMMDFLPSLLLHPCQTTRVYGQSPQISSHEQ